MQPNEINAATLARKPLSKIEIDICCRFMVIAPRGWFVAAE